MRSGLRIKNENEENCGSTRQIVQVNRYFEFSFGPSLIKSAGHCIWVLNQVAE